MLMGKRLKKLLLSSAILSAATISSLIFLTQSKKTLAHESQTSETRILSQVEEKIDQVENKTVKTFLEYYSRNGLTSSSSLPMLDDLRADTRIIVIDTDDADKSLPPAIGTSVDGSEGPVGGTVDADGKYIEFDTSDHSKSATVQEIRDAIAEILG
ncbi:signal peptide [Streptococcus gordonii]|nr:signal peptide [Streptococcus gordonii]